MIKRKPEFDCSQCKIVFFLGPPCSGKKTQAKRLVHDFNYVYLSLGELLKEEVKQVKTHIAYFHRKHN